MQLVATTAAMRRRFPSDPFTAVAVEPKPLRKPVVRIAVGKALIEAQPNLSAPGLQLVRSVSDGLMRSPGKPLVELSPARCGVSRSAFYRGVSELIGLGLLATCKPGAYWVNQHLLSA